MGLLSKVKAAAGAVKARGASAIGALKSSKAVGAVGAFGRRVASSPVGRIASKGVGIGGKAAAVITVGSAVVSGVKALKKKPTPQPSPVITSSRPAKPSKGYSVLKRNTMIGIAGGAALAAAAKRQPAKQGIVEKAIDWVKENPKKTAAIALGAAAVGYGIYRATRKKKALKRKKTSRSRKKRKSSRRSTRRSRSRTRRTKKRRYGSERQYQRKGGLDVKYTKNGQPYVIQSNGRARFVKRSRR